jgi:hypothetical protein
MASPRVAVAELRRELKALYLHDGYPELAAEVDQMDDDQVRSRHLAEFWPEETFEQ